MGENDNKENTRDIISRLLGRSRSNGENLNESRIQYDENHSERMLPRLEQQLRKRQHSLGEHPAFPTGDERHFEEKLISKRYKDVVTNVKRRFGTDSVDNQTLMREMFGMVQDSMMCENNHKVQLQELAEKMIRDEFDMSTEDVEIIAELTPFIDTEGTQKKPSPVQIDEMEFNKHEDIENANGEVYKRRFLNAMIQGNAKKSSHMFHMVEDELAEMDPRLPNMYGKMMSAADYAYYMVDNIEEAVTGGMVRVVFPTNENEKPKIIAQAMVFPVLVHELCKGAMELLSSHGLPEDDKVREFVIGKADFLDAEPWDMRLGPGLWENFCNALPDDSFDIKHHVYMEVASLPVDEFNQTMKEIQAGTVAGKEKIAEICENIKGELSEEEYNTSLASSGGDMDYDDGPDDGLIDNPDGLDDIDIDDMFNE